MVKTKLPTRGRCLRVTTGRVALWFALPFILLGWQPVVLDRPPVVLDRPPAVLDRPPAVSTPLAAATQTLYVSASGTDDPLTNSCRSQATPCPTLTLALEQADVGDVISLAAGTFEEADLLIEADVVIQGAEDGRTTISGRSQSHIFRIAQGATLTLIDVTLASGNGLLGGAIFNDGGVVDVSDSTISGNQAALGGAIFNTNSGTVNLQQVTMSNNTAVDSGGAIFNELGVVNIHNSIVSGNRAAFGGAIVTETGATTNIKDSALTANVATTFGGTVNNQAGTVNLLNTTLADNTAAGSGAGVLNDGGRLNGNQLTLAGNQAQHGGAIATLGLSGLPPTAIRNSIITASGGGDCLGWISGQNNLIDSGSCGLPANPVSELITGPESSDPRWRYRVGKGSNAIDAAADCTAVSSGPNPLFQTGQTIAADIRGLARPVDGDGNNDPRCDIGATEFQPRITITLVSGAADMPITFSGDLGPFVLSDPGNSQHPYDGPGGRLYVVQEQIPAGWTVTNILCSGDADSGSIIDLAAGTVQIDLDAAEFINCTFINQPPIIPTGRIEIIHQAQPATGQPFAYTGDLGDFELSDPSSRQRHFNEVRAGTYAIAEVIPPGWMLQQITCRGDSDNGTVTDVADAATIIDLDADETISCTFANVETAPPPVVVSDLAADIDGVEVNIQWETTAEANLVGFQIQRAESAAGPFVPVNTALIPPQGGGSAYTYTHKTSTGTFYYRIVSILQDQESTNYGPLRVEVLGFPAYMPIIR